VTLYTPLSSNDTIQDLIDTALTKDQETFVIASLPADTWTDFPTSTIPANVGKQIAGFEIRSSTGEDLPLDTQFVEGVWQIKTAIALTNIQIKVEY
jgi:hypothetical protein